MSTGTITSTEHRLALAIRCPVDTCKAPPGIRCNVEAVSGGHAARAHLYLSTIRPEPDAACIAAFTKVDGIRADARPFVHWLSGEYEFRSSPQQAGALTVRVFPVGTSRQISKLPTQGKGTDRSLAGVRRILIDMALRHGLLISSSEGGRGRYLVTERGVAFYRQQQGTVASAS